MAACFVIRWGQAQGHSEQPGGALRMPAPGFQSDQFSGKTLNSRAMAYGMINLRQINAPRVGDNAPDFKLYSRTRKSEIGLKELIAKKPVVLIFGSWGCDVFRETHGGLIALYSEYRDLVDFVMVYTREIHPTDGFAGYLGRVPDPKNDNERRLVAERCQQQLRLPFDILVDKINDPVATRWAGMPVRIYVVDQKSKVIYAGAQGPWGFRPYDGYQHGPGTPTIHDYPYNWNTLENFLRSQFKQ